MSSESPRPISAPPPPPAGGFGKSVRPVGGPPGFPPPPPVGRRGMPGWAIALLVLAAVVFLVVGPLAVLAIHGMNKFISNAKQAEARNTLGMIARDAASVYESDKRLCPSASNPVPKAMVLVTNKKYQSRPEDWTEDESAHAGFSCLKFSLEMPQYYQYAYSSDATSFHAYARGDLDGDGEQSLFVMSGNVVDGELVLAPKLEEKQPDE